MSHIDRPWSLCLGDESLIYAACRVWEWSALTSKSRLQRSVVWRYNHGQPIEERDKGGERRGARQAAQLKVFFKTIVLE